MGHCSGITSTIANRKLCESVEDNKESSVWARHFGFVEEGNTIWWHPPTLRPLAPPSTFLPLGLTMTAGHIGQRATLEPQPLSFIDSCYNCFLHWHTSNWTTLLSCLSSGGDPFSDFHFSFQDLRGVKCLGALYNTPNKLVFSNSARNLFLRWHLMENSHKMGWLQILEWAQV